MVCQVCTSHCSLNMLTICSAPGGFAEYCKYPAKLLHKIGNLPALEAILIEPAACATHGIERMAPKVGSSALLFGCGPTGLLLAQLLRMNGVAHVSLDPYHRRTTS